MNTEPIIKLITNYQVTTCITQIPAASEVTEVTIRV